MYLVLAVAVLIVAPIAENAPDKFTERELDVLRQAIKEESSAPDYIISYIAGNVEELAKVGVDAYQKAGSAKPLEKFQQAGKAILADPLLKVFVESKNWKVTAEVPPASPAPKSGAPASPPFLISINIPELFHGIVKEQGRLRFECTARTTAECIPANGLGK